MENRMKSFIMKSFIVFSVLLLLPALLCAGGLPALPLETLVARSDMIVSGEVVRAWAAFDPENKYIWTHYEIKVSRILKGPAQSSVVIAEPGGTLNGVSHLIPGAAPYAMGEQVTAFLYRTPIGYLRTTNYGQGKFLAGARWADFESQVSGLVAREGVHR